MRVLLVHAYSPRNTGDGLLVELARDMVRQIAPDAEILCVALDAEAFAEADVVQWTPTRNRVLAPRHAVLLAGLAGPHRSLRAAFAQADLIVAVGGGYLRGGTVKEAIKSFLAHVSQLRLAARSDAPSVYLPQSIGPHGWPLRAILTRLLRRIDLVCVRDDRSFSAYRDAGSLVRFPDLAVLEVSRMDLGKQATLIDAPPVVVARDLANPRSYYSLLDDLSKLSPVWAVQSTASNNNDGPLASRLSGQLHPPALSEVLAGTSRQVVISARLHGSMAALLAGSPTIHLSYERKGWGAFEDMGLSDYVFNARDGDSGAVIAALKSITHDPGAYWSRLNENLPTIAARSGELAERISRLVAKNSSLSGSARS